MKESCKPYQDLVVVRNDMRKPYQNRTARNVKCKPYQDPEEVGNDKCRTYQEWQVLVLSRLGRGQDSKVQA